MKIPYFQINSFTKKVFSGNPAGVCLMEEFPSDDILLKIAAENKHSQTAFLVKHENSNADFDLRWFTPITEDNLCGHATLAAAFVLNKQKEVLWPIRFHTRSGVLEVTKNGTAFVMAFPKWIPKSCDVPKKLLPALGLNHAEVYKTRDYLVVVKTCEQVRVLKPDLQVLKKLVSGLGGVIVTAPGSDDGVDYVSRFFAPAAGIDEDPATGSIQCTLAPYWAGKLGKRIFLTKQLSRRGGEMVCELVDEQVKITGSACLYKEGVIYL